MGSRKPSANMKRVKQFKSELGSLDDLFASERHRGERMTEDKQAARKKKACESKNRYSSRSEAQLAIAACAEHSSVELSVYRCPYCDGWHLTSHPWEQD